MRNTPDRRRRGWSGIFRGAPDRWGANSTIHYKGRSTALGQLRQFLRIFLRAVDELCALRRFILELSGHLRWWSFGAFGSKGRLEGGQYLAGRRAPPLNPHQ